MRDTHTFLKLVGEPHEFYLLLVSAAAGPEPRGTNGCPDSLEKRGRERCVFLREALALYTYSPLKG